MPETGRMSTIRDMFQIERPWNLTPIENFSLPDLWLSFLFIGILVITEILMRKKTCIPLMKLPPVLRWAGYYAFLMLIALSWGQTTAQFIYFTF
jgi:hypothetical protein